MSKIIWSALMIVVVALGVVALMLPNPGSLINESKRHQAEDKLDPFGGTEAMTCVKIGPADEDPLIWNLDSADEYGHDDLHHEMEFRDGIWYMDGTSIGLAESEDVAFDACGPVDFMMPIIAEREAIISAGGYGS